MGERQWRLTLPAERRVDIARRPLNASQLSIEQRRSSDDE